jgi:hypothetical protein
MPYPYLLGMSLAWDNHRPMNFLVGFVLRDGCPVAVVVLEAMVDGGSLVEERGGQSVTLQEF